MSTTNIILNDERPNAFCLDWDQSNDDSSHHNQLALHWCESEQHREIKNKKNTGLEEIKLELISLPRL